MKCRFVQEEAIVPHFTFVGIVPSIGNQLASFVDELATTVTNHAVYVVKSGLQALVVILPYPSVQDFGLLRIFTVTGTGFGIVGILTVFGHLIIAVLGLGGILAAIGISRRAAVVLIGGNTALGLDDLGLYGTLRLDRIVHQITVRGLHARAIHFLDVDLDRFAYGLIAVLIVNDALGYVAFLFEIVIGNDDLFSGFIVPKHSGVAIDGVEAENLTGYQNLDPSVALHALRHPLARGCRILIVFDVQDLADSLPVHLIGGHGIHLAVLVKMHICQCFGNQIALLVVAICHVGDSDAFLGKQAFPRIVGAIAVHCHVDQAVTVTICGIPLEFQILPCGNRAQVGIRGHLNATGGRSGGGSGIGAGSAGVTLIGIGRCVAHIVVCIIRSVSGRRGRCFGGRLRRCLGGGFRGSLGGCVRGCLGRYVRRRVGRGSICGYGCFFLVVIVVIVGATVTGHQNQQTKHHQTED